MNDSRLRGFLAGTLGPSLLVLAIGAHGGQSVQPGFYSHEPAEVGLRLSNASSGELCGDADGPTKVCSPAHKIVVTGQQSCDWTDGKQYPCTRYGYQFDYVGAESGQVIQCKARRRNGARVDNKEYVLELKAGEGSIFYPSWSAFSPVEKRVIMSEVHECSYQDALLTTIEFLLYYEPDANPAPAAGSATGIDEPLFTEIPNACGYLTEPLAKNLLRVGQVRAGPANEHIPNFWSQCAYSGQGVSGRNVRFVFKFMLYELYDVANLDPMQLDFNATFTGGGDPPVDKLTDLGKVSFVFEKGDVTTLMVVTGIQGPPDGANRPTEFVATYYLVDPDTPHAVRLEKLRAKAEEHLRDWHSGN